MLFFISKEPRKALLNNPKLQQCQVELDPKVNSFLSRKSKKSYVNCSDPVTTFTIAEIKHQLRKDMGRIKGQIDENSRKNVIKSVNSCPKLEQRKKQQILAFLQPPSEIKNT